MAGWKKHFIISGCTRFVLPGIGEIDASKENISEEKLLKAYRCKCPYVGLTPEGIKKYDPEKTPIEVKQIIPEIVDDTKDKQPEPGPKWGNQSGNKKNKNKKPR